ncbi:MAG: GGDEF domain-containing protein [Myxococcales bacterium]|nr:GGDEF domain-containing protein [Myxococcales bacterium]
MQDAERALEVLLGLTRDLLEERSLNRALALVTEAALKILPGDHASIRVLDQTRTELLSGARSGIGENKQPVRHKAGQGIAGWVVDHGDVVRLSDATQDQRFVIKQKQGFKIRGMLAVPLWSAGEVVGVLATTSGDPDVYDESHETLAMLLANCAVPPIEKARLARLAITDAHTMAFNQAYLIPGLRAEMGKLRKHRGQLSLLLMDLDHFKDVNDRFGHSAGDEALRVFASRIRATTRDQDILVRRGGDEFVLIMPGTDRASAVAVAERIHRAMAGKPLNLGAGRTAEVTVSVGVATWDGHESPEKLEQRADEAMYEVKVHGRDGVRTSELPSAAAETDISAASEPSDQEERPR